MSGSWGFLVCFALKGFVHLQCTPCPLLMRKPGAAGRETLMGSPSPPPPAQAGFANTCLRHFLLGICLPPYLCLGCSLYQKYLSLTSAWSTLCPELIYTISQLTPCPTRYHHLSGMEKTRQGRSSPQVLSAGDTIASVDALYQYMWISLQHMKII